MPLFKKKEVKTNQVFIPRWEDLPYCSLATEWGILTDGVRIRTPKLNQAKSFEITECLWLMTNEKGQEYTMLGQRGWTLVSAHCKIYENKLKLFKRN